MYPTLKTLAIKKQLLILILSLIFFEVRAQNDNSLYKAGIEIQSIGTTNNVVPFWMRSNKFGSIPNSGISGSVIGKISRSFESSSPVNLSRNKNKVFDWGFDVEARFNGGRRSEIQIISANIKTRLSIFQLKIGRDKDVMGLNGDTSLSSGNFAVSGNALGIPKIELSIPNYYRLPILDGLFSFKGTFNHGWLGKVRILDSIVAMGSNAEVFYIKDNHPKTYFHQKSLYGRLGKENWKFQLYGGFSHQVFWGNEQTVYGDNFKLSPFQTFAYVITGRAYGARGVPTSKIGNQLGSIDLSAEYSFRKHVVNIYRQTFYDVGALSKLANIRDGLQGISILNKNYQSGSNSFIWKKVLFEHFYSKDQAGYPWSKPTKSGDEDYYNNFYYRDGWSYKAKGIGSPLITPRIFAKGGQAYNNADYFINNRVVAYHLGFSGGYKSWDFSSKITYSNNHGTFGTSIYGNSTGTIRNPISRNLFTSVKQYSLYFESSKTLKNNLTFGIAMATDFGKLLDNSVGLQLRIVKNFTNL